jgi:phage baseplate assembly protein W
VAVLEARFGTDLWLLPSLEATHSSRDPGNDLQVRTSPAGEQDLGVLSGRDNLFQALILRLLTPTGELAALGHPDYGSRLHELIGELNTAANRNRVKMLALQAITAEPRIKRVVSLDVIQARDDRTRVDVTASLEVIDGDTPLNLVFPFFFEGGAP